MNRGLTVFLWGTTSFEECVRVVTTFFHGLDWFITSILRSCKGASVISNPAVQSVSSRGAALNPSQCASTFPIR